MLMYLPFVYLPSKESDSRIEVFNATECSEQHGRLGETAQPLTKYPWTGDLSAQSQKQGNPLRGAFPQIRRPHRDYERCQTTP